MAAFSVDSGVGDQVVWSSSPEGSYQRRVPLASLHGICTCWGVQENATGAFICISIRIRVLAQTGLKTLTESHLYDNFLFVKVELNLGACKFITGPVYKKERFGEKRSLKATSKRALKSNFTNTTPSTNPWDFFFFWLEEIQNSPAAHSFCQQTWSSEMLRISVENFLFLVIFGSLWLLGFHCVPNSLHFPSMHLPVCVSSPLSFFLSSLCILFY